MAMSDSMLRKKSSKHLMAFNDLDTNQKLINDLEQDKIDRYADDESNRDTWTEVNNEITQLHIELQGINGESRINITENDMKNGARLLNSNYFHTPFNSRIDGFGNIMIHGPSRGRPYKEPEFDLPENVIKTRELAAQLYFQKNRLATPEDPNYGTQLPVNFRINFFADEAIPIASSSESTILSSTLHDSPRVYADLIRNGKAGSGPVTISSPSYFGDGTYETDNNSGSTFATTERVIIWSVTGAAYGTALTSVPGVPGGNPPPDIFEEVDINDLSGIKGTVGLGNINGNISTIPEINRNAEYKYPIPKAGNNQGVMTGTLVNLNGGASSDPDGNSFTYLWTFDSVPGGSALTNTDIINSTTATPSFTPDVDGQYVLKMTIQTIYRNDYDLIVIDAAGVVPPSKPTSEAGDNDKTDLVSFNLNGPGGMDTYNWTFISKPAGSGTVINNSTLQNANFTPDVVGEYKINLEVSLGGVSDNDHIIVLGQDYGGNPENEFIFTVLAEGMMDVIPSWLAFLNSEKTALEANPNQTDSNNIAALADVNNALSVVNTWFADNEKWSDSALDALLAEMIARSSFIGTRATQITTSLGDVSGGINSCLAGLCSGLYTDRFIEAGNRLDKSKGTLSNWAKVEEGRGAVEGQVWSNIQSYRMYELKLALRKVELDATGQYHLYIEKMEPFNITPTGTSLPQVYAKPINIGDTIKVITDNETLSPISAVVQDIDPGHEIVVGVEANPNPVNDLDKLQKVILVVEKVILSRGIPNTYTKSDNIRIVKEF
jgi:hypothetical protein